MFYLGKRSRSKLDRVHPDLVIVMAGAIRETDIDFAIIEGRRTLARQKKLVAAGASKTLKSRHLTGHAVDIVCYLDGQVAWDWPLYSQVAKVIKQVAKESRIPIEWGGDWRSFKDGPHFQLPWKEYAA